MYTPSEVLDAVLSQLDKLQVSGLANVQILSNIVNNLTVLKAAFDDAETTNNKEGAADGDT